MVLYAYVECESSLIRNNKQSNGAEWLIAPLGAAQEPEALRTGVRQRQNKILLFSISIPHLHKAAKMCK